MKIEVYSPTIRRKEMDAVLTALVEDKIGPGEQSRLLTQIAKEHLGFDYCMVLRSPAIAATLALKALGLEDGQGVLISALSPRYYLTVIESLRLVPIICDVSAASPLLSRESVDAAVKRRPDAAARAVLVHDTLGYQGDFAALAELGLPIIEDRSQSYRPPVPADAETAASGAIFTIMGLEERDMLTAGGGALLYAPSRRDASVLRGMGDLPPEYGLPDMNAAMAVIQFKEAVKNHARRAEIAALYTQAALRSRHKRFVQQDDYNNYAFALALETGLKDVKAYAKRKEIAVESAFDQTIMGAAAAEGADDGDEKTAALKAACPEAYSLSLRTVLFPLYPRLQASEAERVSKLIMTLP